MARRPNQDDEIVNSLLAGFMRLNPRAKIALIVAALLIGLLVFYVQRHSAPSISGNANALLGNPSDADGSPRNYLMVKPYFVLSYNSDRGIPNWVSWQVSSADLGTAPRKQMFDADSTLPAGFSVITQRDYNGSGFDRGHMCPHSDRAANTDMSYATFVMTNIIPQAPNVNRKAWEQLESYCRDLVSHEHDRLYILAGPSGQGGRGSKGFASSIAGGKVIVPAECWKIVVVVPDSGGDDLSKISATTRVIAVLMPNDNEVVNYEWDKFRTSAAEIESKTGLHFFTALRADIAQALRSKVDAETISPPRPHYGGSEEGFTMR